MVPIEYYPMLSSSLLCKHSYHGQLVLQLYWKYSCHDPVFVLWHQARNFRPQRQFKYGGCGHSEQYHNHYFKVNNTTLIVVVVV